MIHSRHTTVSSFPWLTMLCVFAGGSIGTGARIIAMHLLPLSWHPVAIINVTGSTLLGLIAGIHMHNSHIITHHWLMFAATGFCGGFTTMSSFALDIYQSSKPPGQVLLTTIITCVIGFSCTFTTYSIGQRVHIQHPLRKA